MHSFELPDRVAVVTDPAAVEPPADTAVETFDGLHIWVNDAGGSPVRAPRVTGQILTVAGGL